MKTKPLLRRRSIFRTIFGIFSLGGIMFAFQACYGTPQDFGMDIQITGKVISGGTKAGIPHIRVGVLGYGGYQFTENDGTFTFYTERMSEFRFTFTDLDGAQNGTFQPKDTLVVCPESAETLDIQIELN